MRQYKNSVSSIKFVAMFFILTCALNARAQSPALPSAADPGNQTQNIIQSLSVTSMPGGKLMLKVGLKEAPAKPPLNFTINTPPRIAFDFPNTANGLGKSTQEFGEGELRSANVVQAGNRTRLVVNLNQMLVYDTRVEGNTLLITLHGKVADTAASATAQFAEAKPSAQKHSLRDIDFHRGKNGEGRVQVDLSDTSVGIDVGR